MLGSAGAAAGDDGDRYRLGDPPREFEIRATGDLSGRGVWTLTQRGDAVHVRFDWRVNADRALLRVLTPVLRPVFRWNHNYAIKRAMAGLEPYARTHSATHSANAETTSSS